MKKGIAQIVLGVILIGLQLFSVIGAIKSGTPLPTLGFGSPAFAFDVSVCIGYYFFGILGLVFLIVGLVIYNKK